MIITLRPDLASSDVGASRNEFRRTLEHIRHDSELVQKLLSYSLINGQEHLEMTSEAHHDVY